MRKLFSTLPVILLVTACGGSGGGGKQPSTAPTQNTSTAIHTFEMLDTSGTPLNPVTIDPAINSGEFKISWDITSSTQFHMNLYASADDVFSTSDDIRFYSRNCDSNGIILSCSDVGEVDCRFTNENKISCGEITEENPEKNISEIITTIPITAHLFMKVCNGLSTSCKVSPIEVTFL